MYRLFLNAVCIAQSYVLFLFWFTKLGVILGQILLHCFRHIFKHQLCFQWCF